jgi:hypothetical protein
MAWALVKRVFKKYPLVANCGVYGTLYVGAEFSQQTINKKFLVTFPSELFCVLLLALTRAPPPKRVCVVHADFCTNVSFLQAPSPEPYDQGTLARYGVVGTFIYPTILYNWYFSVSFVIIFYFQLLFTAAIRPSAFLFLSHRCTKLLYFYTKNQNA